MLQFVTLFIVLTSANNVIGAKILVVFPIPVISHENVYRTLLQELAGRGHEVTVMKVTDSVTDRGLDTEAITEINLKDVSYRIWRNYSSNIESNQNVDTVYKLDQIFKRVNHLFIQQLNKAEMKKMIEEKHSYFDLLLLDASVISVLGLSHIFKAPVILINTMGATLDNHETVGAPTHPLLYPRNFRRRVHNLTVWEKMAEFYMHVRLEAMYRSIENNVDLMLKNHFGPDFPPLKELKNNVHMLFLNINTIWAGNQPVPPNVVYIGGMQPNNNEDLSQDLISYLDKSKFGVIYLSFGSNIRPSRLPPKAILSILDVLSELRYDVLLKWDLDSLPGVPKNIKIFQWLPQRSLLKHPKIKLFITNGGLQSTEDAINAGVPVVGIPMFGDQWYNTEKYVQFHIGMQLNFASLSQDKLIKAVRTVISDGSYRHNIVKLRTLMYDQPQAPLERAVWWTEYVLRHGGAKHLRSPAANMSWAEYYEIKVILTLIFLLCAIFVVFIASVTIVFRYVIINRVSDTKKKRN